jgi:molybdopterin synthase catalytic subunit
MSGQTSAQTTSAQTTSAHTTAAQTVSVQTEDFDVGAEYAELRRLAANVGAVTTFTGLVREFYQGGSCGDSDNRVLSLYLEHYPGMTEKALQDIVNKARDRWQILSCKVIHRIGELYAGDQIVFVGVASAHRGDAFAAAEFIMDYLKTQAPFWKKQRTSAGEDWIESRDSDKDAASRWQI